MKEDLSRGIATDGGDGFVTECDTSESVAQAVLRSLASVSDVSETDLEPLYQNVDPDALETLIHHSDCHASYVAVEFTMEGHTVLVRGDGTIRIDPGPPRTARGDEN